MAKNGGYDYLSEKSILTSFAGSAYYFCRFLGYSNPDDLIRDRETIKAKFTQDELLDLILTILNYRILDKEHLNRIKEAIEVLINEYT